MILVIISLLVIGALCGLASVSYNNKVKKAHNTTLSALNNRLLTNFRQISRREMALNKYDFLKYNLNESLLVQPEIMVQFGSQNSI